MQPILPTHRSRFASVLRASLLLIAAGSFVACDRHSAEEAPENYGHGSSHERVVADHEIDSHDSKNGLKSFSDTAGTKDDLGEKKSAESADSPTPTPAPHFF